jgi:aspartate-semialdehyde dehydrogenase
LSLKVAILGATGAVGSEMVRVLETRNFPVSELRPLATMRSAGKPVHFRGTAIKPPKSGRARSTASTTRCSRPAPTPAAPGPTLPGRPARP